MKKANLYKKDMFITYVFVAAPILQFLLLVLGPLLYSLYGSFTNWNVLSGMKWIGPQNYLNIFADAKFYKAMFNTVFLMLGIPIGIALALLLAIFLNRKLFGSRTFRVLYYLPVVSSAVAVSVVWKWIFNGEYGILNSMLGGLFGITGPNWLSDANWIKPAMIIVMVWRNLGAWMLFYLAALQNIPKQYYEAASLDGAGSLRSFWNITIPLISPITFYLVIIAIIGNFQTFAEIYIFAPKGGTGFSGATIVYYIWDKAFRAYEMGYASAMSWILGIIMFVITLIQFKVSDKWVHEVN